MKIFIPLILFFIPKNETNFASPINNTKNEFNNINSAFLQVPNSSSNEFELIPSARSAFAMKIPLRTVRVNTFGEDESDVPETEIICRLQEIANHSATKEEKQNDEDLSSLVNTTIGLGPCFFGRCDVRIGTIGVGTPTQQFDVIMSFASSEFWIYGSKNLMESICREGKRHKHVYDSNISSSANITEREIKFSEIVRIGRNHWRKRANGKIVYETIQVGNTSVKNVEIGSIDDVNLDYCASEFKLASDGQMGLMLVNETGWAANKIPSPIRGIVARANSPLITIAQKPAKFEWDESILDGSLTIGNDNDGQCSSFSQPLPYNATKLYDYRNYLEGQPRIHAKSMKLSDGFDLAIKPREAAIVEGLGIQLYKEEAVRFGQHLRSFGARRIQPGFYRIPCDARGKLPTIHLELDSRGNSSVVIDFNEYVINIRKKRCLLGVLINILSIYYDNEPILIGNGMLQGKCISINVIEQTIAFGTTF